MQTFKQLVFISQSVEREQALFQWALDFAKQHQAKLLVLTVLPDVSPGLVGWVKNILPAELMKKKTVFELESRKAWADQAHDLDVDIVLKVEFGKLFYKATQTAQRVNADFMVKQIDQEPKGLSHHIFGSQDMSLLRVCPCPVLLHKHGTRLPFNRVMASIDVDIESEYYGPTDLNEKILDWSKDFASAQQASLHVVHAWFANAENLVRYWNADLTEMEILQFTQKVQQQHAAAVDYEIQEIREAIPDVRVHLPKGLPAEAVPHVVEMQKIDLLVMGTLGRTGIPGLVMGNTAESILGAVTCSVLAVKPSRFVSPVKI